MKRGDVVRLGDRAVFKLGVVIGVSARCAPDGETPVHVHSPNEHRTHRNALKHRRSALGAS